MSAPAPAGGEESATGDFVLDVSLSCAWGFGHEASEEAWAVLERLQAGRAHVPALWIWETANVLVQAERRGRITPAAIRSFLGLLEALPIRIDHLAGGADRQVAASDGCAQHVGELHLLKVRQNFAHLLAALGCCIATGSSGHQPHHRHTPRRVMAITSPRSTQATSAERCFLASPTGIAAGCWGRGAAGMADELASAKVWVARMSENRFPYLLLTGAPGLADWLLLAASSRTA